MTRRIGLFIRCANTLSYIHGLSGSYDTEAWKYYIINLKFSKLQQIFRPRIILLIQVHPKNVYSREIKKYQLGSVRVRRFSKLQQIFRPRTILYIYIYLGCKTGHYLFTINNAVIIGKINYTLLMSKKLFPFVNL